MMFSLSRRACLCASLILVLLFVMALMKESVLIGTASAQVVSPGELEFSGSSRDRSSPTSFASPQDKEDWEYRQTYGHYNVVWMNGLVEAYLIGFITEEDLLWELRAERPVRTANLLEYHGSLTSFFLLDVVYAESNGPSGQLENGTLVFFDTTQYLDRSGAVMRQFARDYNTATRANRILQEVLEQWYAGTEGPGIELIPLNHKCCGNTPEDCETTQTNRRSSMAGATCATGSHQCTVAY